MIDVIYNLHKEKISKVLREMADAVDSGECIGGFLEFELEKDNMYSCRAMYRIVDSLGIGDISPLNSDEKQCLQKQS